MIAHYSKTSFSSKTIFCVLVVLLLWNSLTSQVAKAQTAQSESSTRKLKLSTPPEYPELARRLHIEGVARVLLTVTPDGRVIAVKELGGNPVLVGALSQAVKKWKYEPSDHDSEIEVRFEFTEKR